MRVGINGLGRIGRIFLRAAWNNPKIEIVAANSLGDIEQCAHLIKYDTIYGKWDREVKVSGQSFLIDGKEIKYFEKDNPESCPWKEEKIDLVVEATGAFTKKEKALGHLKGGAKNVLITAPGRGEIATVVFGVNEEEIDLSRDQVFSAASCTTNCLVPIAKVLNDQLGIENGFMTTVHAYTNDQNIHDAFHKKDLRRSRAACESIIPTSTGAARGIGEVIKDLNGKMDGISLRVPVAVVSILDLVLMVEKETTKEEVNGFLEEASREGKLKDVLGVEAKPLVSADFRRDDRASIVDLELTKVINGKMVKLLAWYDNEWGYVKQLVRLLDYLTSK
jgi:glyceraldehyde 3-phosphate dehydrogenase